MRGLAVLSSTTDALGRSQVTPTDRKASQEGRWYFLHTLQTKAMQCDILGTHELVALLTCFYSITDLQHNQCQHVK